MPNKKLGNFSTELLDRARELYVSGVVNSYQELADRSVELLGQHLTVDTVKLRSKDDEAGDWILLRSQARVGNASAELEDIRSMLYLDIMNPETPAQSRAQLTNAYMTLLSKGNMNKGVSAKTSLEQALDLKAEALSELSSEDLDDE
jgi:hypothetical protein